MEKAYYNLLYDILRGYDRCTPKRIDNLRNNQIFVFGTDKYGSQKHGAAGLAANKFGAKPGVVDGPTGMCYALPTKGFSLEELSHAVQHFEQYVRNNFRYTFLVTAVGCGHAGFNVKIVADMFIGMIGLKNVMLPEDFLKVYREECRDNLFSLVQDAKVPQNDDLQESLADVLIYFDESLHDVIRYLDANKIEFDRDGGFCLTNEDGNVIAEAELGIESEKVVFLPLNDQCSIAFKSNGYTILTPEEYLNSKMN